MKNPAASADNAAPGAAERRSGTGPTLPKEDPTRLHVTNLCLSSVLAVLLLACESAPSRAPLDDPVADLGLVAARDLPNADGELRVWGPRPLSEAERDHVLVDSRPIPVAEEGGPPVTPAEAAAPKVSEDALPPAVDLTGFVVEQADPGEDAPSEAVLDGDGAFEVRQSALSGPVYAGSRSYSGYVSRGGSVRYQFQASVLTAVLMPNSGDADLYLETCNGTRVASSTRGGTATDTASMYSSTGQRTCMQVRVCGYAASSYSLRVFYHW